ncbi:LETM1-domain-containing protein [Basidiobolus meristosporus CBS 931.73]|uniref:LETM1-domain-containing protein n=1 Tax=Basidiobolus meristosporus CBS 931.73 TaxID=1314790 RepID=A0A1Y1XSH2_9FUNG|nr:LETM1-domain-containing protein [Basidiobolus meristosporus CBS 931.73]|eukprot:ORX88707.1 LETM1-domain-containing protein [Basidiobolus meristosporus CBS 931.73]
MQSASRVVFRPIKRVPGVFHFQPRVSTNYTWSRHVGFVRNGAYSRVYSTAKPPMTIQERIQSWADNLSWEKMKELARFYKNGLKQVWVNNEKTKLLKIRQSQGYQLTRKEFQLVSKAPRDFRKLIPFGMLALVLPEVIPLIIGFAPRFVPSTCVTASQLEKQRNKVNEKRAVITRNVLKSSVQNQIKLKDFKDMSKVAQLAKKFPGDFDLANINRNWLKGYCRYMGLSEIGTRKMLENRLKKHFEYLTIDDKLIQKEGVESLTFEELQAANEERGMRGVDLPPVQLRRSLEDWIELHLMAEPRVPLGLMVFSRAFVMGQKPRLR